MSLADQRGIVSAGDCYEAAAKFVIAQAKRPGIRLMHGEVTGTGGAVVCLRYGHAWVELGGAVIDPSNGRCLVATRRNYYAAGQVGAIRVYTPKEAIAFMLKTRHYGPWENPAESNRCSGVERPRNPRPIR
jgi:hypothetical protein